MADIIYALTAHEKLLATLRGVFEANPSRRRRRVLFARQRAGRQGHGVLDRARANAAWQLSEH